MHREDRTRLGQGIYGAYGGFWTPLLLFMYNLIPSIGFRHFGIFGVSQHWTADVSGEKK